VLSTRARESGITRLLWPYLKPQLGALSIALLLGFVLAMLGAVQPLLTRIVIDQGLIAHHFHRLIAACLCMLTLALVALLLGGVHRAIYVRASGRTLFAMRGAAYAHLMRVSPRRLAEMPVGELVTRLDGDVAEVQRFGTNSAAASVSALLTLCVVGTIMIGLSWRLTLLVGSLLPLQLGIRHFARPRIEATTRAMRSEAGRVGGFLIETLMGARAVQGAAAERLEVQRLGALGESYLSRVLTAQLVAYSTGSFSSLLGHIATVATFVLGGWYVLNGALSIGTLVAFVAYLGRVSGSAGSLAGLYTGYQRARVSLERVHQLFALPVVPECPRGLALPSRGRCTLRFEAVTVALRHEGRPLLDQVTLDIPGGCKLVLRGASGVGKTTISDLLRRFIEPDSGRILLQGTPLDRFRLHDLRRRIVVVEHSPTLFRGTILENLRYGHSDLTEAAVLKAALNAGVDTFVRDLPLGYLTVIGEGGAGLSTGQRQRIAIARAALADPLVVILDEATSGLDREAARDVHRSIDESFPDTTRIVITHHAADVERTDLCWLLDAGTLLPAALAS